MKIKLNQNLNQKLILSQKMRQALSILSLSHEELKQVIQEELLENPLLEVKEGASSPSTVSRPPADLFASFYDQKDFPSRNSIENTLTEPPSLKSFVLKQVEMSPLPEKIKILLKLLISYLDERAYLTINLKEMAQREEIPLNLLEEALRTLQGLEPAGLGGRNLQECLLIQLRNKKSDTRIPQLIIKSHIHNLRERKYKNIAYDLDISFKRAGKAPKDDFILRTKSGKEFF